MEEKHNHTMQTKQYKTSFVEHAHMIIAGVVLLSALKCYYHIGKYISTQTRLMLNRL